MEGKGAVAVGLGFLGMGLDRVRLLPLPLPRPLPEKLSSKALRGHVYSNYLGSRWAVQRWWRPLLLLWLVGFTLLAHSLFYNGSSEAVDKRRDSLASMCDERARMLQDQFNVSMNHLQALAILVSTFHHAQNPSAINQATFARYAERTAFERPLTSGVAYAVRVTHAERDHFERQQGWSIKKMYSSNKKYGPSGDAAAAEIREPAEEYAPVIFAQDAYKNVISFDMLSGVVREDFTFDDRENIIRARESGKGVLTAPFKLLNSRLGVILTYTVYNTELPANARPQERIQVAIGFMQKPPLPWSAITSSIGTLVIGLLLGYIFYATMHRIEKVEDDYQNMIELKKRAEDADVAKSQQDYVRTAQASGKALVSLVNEVLDQAKIESGKLELEAAPFDLRLVCDDILSLFCGKAQEKGLELAVYVSDQVPQTLIGDPGRMRQIITNLMGNSIKFTKRGHIYLTVHVVEEVMVETGTQYTDTLSGYLVANRRHSWESLRLLDMDLHSSEMPFTPIMPETIKLIISVEDTGAGIPLEAQSRIFTPFMQVGPSIARIHGGTGIGLSISKCLVHLMKGEIGFVSKPHVGSTFSFTAVLTRSRSNANVAKSSGFKGINALVIDHRPVRAKVTKYHLQRLGVKTELTTDVNQVIAKMNCGSLVAKLVLVEQETWLKESHSMPHLLSKLRSKDLPDSPKFFLLENPITSIKSNSHISREYNLNVIMKPLRASMLQVSLRRALGGVDKAHGKNGNSTLGSLLHKKQIIVVDDNVVNLKVAAGALKKYGAEVVCADNGKKAIALLTPPHSFDACFMDIQMPEMDGFEATRRIRVMERDLNERIEKGEMPPECANIRTWRTPILAMTADVIQATYEECLRCEMDGYVSKPFEGEQLYREVTRFFQNHDQVQ
ncbi:hypothetical protein ACQ4PT_065304 [Festuca glaucescens]